LRERRLLRTPLLAMTLEGKAIASLRSQWLDGEERSFAKSAQDDK